MSEQHDPMCQVPLSYLTMLQERRDAERTHAITYRPDSKFYQDKGKPWGPALDELNDKLTKKERDDALQRIAEFEERAGCKLEHIPVEALADAQNAYVSQQAIDTLKAENEALCKRVNELVSQATERRSASERADEKVAPYGFTKAGVPRKKPGRKVPRRRAA